MLSLRAESDRLTEERARAAAAWQPGMSAFGEEYISGDGDGGDGVDRGSELGQLEFGMVGGSMSASVDEYVGRDRSSDRDRDGGGDIESCEHVDSVRSTKALPGKKSGDVEPSLV